MPVERIDDALDQPGEVPQFAVLGRYSLGARFVEHVGLLAKQENWKSLQSEVHVHEMGISAKVGPLSIESIDEPPTMKGDLIGYVELRKTHRNAIKTYLAELDDDVARNGSGFIIMPPSDRSSSI